MPQYEKYPTSSNQVEGRTFDLFKSKNKRKPVHKYAKKTAKRLISEPVIEYGFVPIKDEPNLFHKEYYTVGANEMINGYQCQIYIISESEQDLLSKLGGSKEIEIIHRLILVIAMYCLASPMNH